MSGRYTGMEVAAAPSTGCLRVEFTLRNNSKGYWRRGEGYALGWQIYDPRTGLFIAEGEWVPLPVDLGPGASAPVSLDLILPPQSGHYRVYISPVQEKRGWLFERGGELLVVDAEVSGDAVRVVGWRATTLRRLRRENLGPWVRKVFVEPWNTLWQNRSLIRSMVRRDILARYRGSFGDAFWAVLHPLLLMVTYFFVFGVVLQTRFGADPSRTGFALYFLAGMLPWLAFSEPAGRAPQIVLEHRNFVKKLLFPVETLPVNAVVSGLVTELLATGLFVVALAAMRGAVPVTALWLPVLWVPQVLFTLGLCWFLAGLGAYVRDLAQVMGFLLTLWFFLTPICYPEASLPAAALPWLAKNPMFVLVRGYRTILLEGQAPAWVAMAKLWALSLVVFLAGHAWFYKLKRSFADSI